MKISPFVVTRLLLPMWGVLLAPVALGQTFYSPAGEGVVGTVERKNANPENISFNIFAWDLNANTTAIINRDAYVGDANSSLTINGFSGEFFRVILGTNVDLTNAFWNSTQTWANFITSSGNGVVPTLNQSNVSTYTYSGATYTSVNTSSQGAFSLSSNTLTWTPSLIPEPTSALAGILLVGGLLRRRR